MRVLFADRLHDSARTRLASVGFEVLTEPGLSGADLTRRIVEVEPQILVVRSTRVEAADADAGHSLALVIRAGAGVNTIDVAACSRRGIFVANCPAKNAVAVAELTWGLILCLDRFLPDNVADLRAGRWNKATYSRGLGLNGRTLGLLGVGAIGRAVAARAHGFGMSVVAWSRSLTPETASSLGITRLESPEAVASIADVVSVHVALTPETRGLIGDSVFGAMRHGASFVNTSRAEVIDESSLARALDTKGIRAGLDVFSGEPSTKEGPFQHPLASHPSVYGTHHIGASTVEAQVAVGEEVCRVAEGFRDQGQVRNVVNGITHTAATHRLDVRHLDQVGVLARVLDGLSRAHLNVQEMENLVFPGGAAIARIQIAGIPDASLMSELSEIDAVLSATVVGL